VIARFVDIVGIVVSDVIHRECHQLNRLHLCDDIQVPSIDKNIRQIKIAAYSIVHYYLKKTNYNIQLWPS
jgi:hypothetical protein